jgi:hypothetical protein
MALKIYTKSTIINAGEHNNTVYVGSILCNFELGSHWAVIRQQNKILQVKKIMNADYISSRIKTKHILSINIELN